MDGAYGRYEAEESSLWDSKDVRPTADGRDEEMDRLGGIGMAIELELVGGQGRQGVEARVGAERRPD